MGEIFLARGPQPGGGVGLSAVKRLLPQAAADPVFVNMFLDEGRLVKQLEHPNICRVWDLGQTEDHYYLAMEWLDGVSLQLLLRRAAGRGGIPIPIAARIAEQVASALDYAHRLNDEEGQHLGIVHRDVSPPNIIIELSGRVRLLDFGLAKARTQLAKTQPGYVKGKFGYMAPEQLSGKVDYRTDVFALGLCLYEALTGRKVFSQTTAGDTITAIRGYDQAPSVRERRPDVPEALDAIVQKALAPRPSQRYSSAGEMQLYLQRAVEKSGPPATDADLAALVSDLFPAVKAESVDLDMGEIPPSAAAVAAHAVDLEAPSERGTGRLALLVLLLCAVLTAAGVAAFMLK